jgi:integrase
MLRLAYKWKILRRVPAVSFLRGERNREVVLSREQEVLYLEIAPKPLRTVAIILLDTGLRMRELLTLEWTDVHLDAPAGASFGYLTIRSGKSKNSKSRNVPLSSRVTTLLRAIGPKETGLVLRRTNGLRLSQTYLNEQARSVRQLLRPACVSSYVRNAPRRSGSRRLYYHEAHGTFERDRLSAVCTSFARIY